MVVAGSLSVGDIAGDGIIVKDGIVGNEKLTFENKKHDFSGRMLLVDGKTVFDRVISMKLHGNNTAVDGGAINVGNNASLEIEKSNMSFTDNYASGKGGAIYLGNGATIGAGTGGINFTSNTAASSGGAIFVEDGVEVNFDANEGDIIFEGNKQNNGNSNNDIYLAQNAIAVFMGSKDIRLKSGITGEDNTTITKSGVGNLYLYGKDNNIKGTMTISRGSLIFEDGVTYTGKDLSVDGTGNLNMANGTYDKVTLTGGFKQSYGTTLKMDVFAGNDGGNAADLIGAKTIDIQKGILEVNVKDSQLYADKRIEVTLMESSDQIKGVDISNLSIYEDATRPVIFDADWFISEDGQHLKLGMEVFKGSQFLASIPSGLSFNQIEMARAFDGVDARSGKDINYSLRDIWNNYLGNGMTKESILELLAEASPYFYANIIRNTVDEYIDKEVYNKVAVGITDETRRTHSIWVQTHGGQQTLKEDDNSLEKYNQSDYGVTAGFDTWVRDNLTLGVFVKYQRDDIEQGENSGNIDEFGGGLYGGVRLKRLEIKGLVAILNNEVSANRVIPGHVSYFSGNQMKADFSAISFNGDIEASIKELGIGNMEFRPYLGLKMADTRYGEVLETGDAALAAKMGEKSYFRSSARLGGEIRYGEENAFSWYGNVEAKYLLAGNLPEIEWSFLKSNDYYRSRGFEEAKLSIGVGLGVAANVSANTRLYLDGNYSGAENYSGYMLNLGIKYNFGDLIRERKEKDRIKREISLKEEERMLALKAEKERLGFQKRKRREARSGVYLEEPTKEEYRKARMMMNSVKVGDVTVGVNPIDELDVYGENSSDLLEKSIVEEALDRKIEENRLKKVLDEEDRKIELLREQKEKVAAKSAIEKIENEKKAAENAVSKVESSYNAVSQNLNSSESVPDAVGGNVEKERTIEDVISGGDNAVKDLENVKQPQTQKVENSDNNAVPQNLSSSESIPDAEVGGNVEKEWTIEDVISSGDNAVKDLENVKQPQTQKEMEEQEKEWVGEQEKIAKEQAEKTKKELEESASDGINLYIDGKRQ
jgi:predicted outer membrane repeat protein